MDSCYSHFEERDDSFNSMMCGGSTPQHDSIDDPAWLKSSDFLSEFAFKEKGLFDQQLQSQDPHHLLCHHSAVSILHE